MTPEEALTYIHSVCWKGSIPGLGRTQELLAKMGNPQNQLQFVHIAGTNGKGSTAAMTASILRQAGYRVGLYTSPYIFRFHERMQVDGQCISDEELAEITEFVKPLAESMADHPTEFELVTCIAMEYFKRHHCDVVSLEVGMGGELDSTNVILPPLVAVLTNIGLDHTEFLGDTLEKICETKSKIIKPGSIAVTYREKPSVEAVIEARCREVGARWMPADFDAIHLISASLEGQIFDWGPYEKLHLPLLGQHQLYNAAVVLTIVNALREKGLPISDEAVRTGIASVSWPGRFELVARNPLFIVDGGHNPQCIEALVNNVRDYLNGRTLTILTGVLADKDYSDMYADMAQYAACFVTVTPPNPRALEAKDLAAYLSRYGKPVQAAETVEAGVALAKELAGPEGVVLAYGSLYMVGDIEAAARGEAV